MKKPDTSLIDQEWPAGELEAVHNCPFCGSAERTIAYENVQDWSFYCAPGKWTYWDCAQCEALYLNPRPTEASIGMAYSVYYTHGTSLLRKFYASLRERLRNECWFAWFDIKITPRIGLPFSFHWLLMPLRQRLSEPFLQIHLNKLPKGKLLDIGCGNGMVMGHAQQMGWQVTGFEIDPEAVRTATNAGLDVVQANYDQVDQFTEQFDCVICSHVLEHLHQPMDLLKRIKQVLKPGGYAILVLPNALSAIRMQYGQYWRGLEAPRHLGIPSSLYLVNTMKGVGLEVILMNTHHNETQAESEKIARGNHSSKTKKILSGDIDIRTQPLNSKNWTSDFTKIVARKI